MAVEFPLLSFYQDISRLVSLAFEGPTSTHTDAFAVVVFIKGLDNCEVSMKIMKLEPRNLCFPIWELI